MIDGRKVVAWIPYGRRQTVEILFKYLQRDQELGIVDEVWLYMNTDPDQAEDKAYAFLLKQRHTWVQLRYRPPNRPVFAQKQRNTGYFYRYAATEPDTIFIRFDDDVIYIHPGTIGSLVEHQLVSPATCSFPLIINNARVSYLLQRNDKIPVGWGTVTDDCMDGVGWGDGEFATLLHQKLIDAIRGGTVEEEFFTHHHMPLNRDQFSVSCFASKGSIYAEPFAEKLREGIHEEESWHTEVRPNHVDARNVVLCDALVAHYTFFTQRRWFDDGVILKQYRELAEEL